MSNIKEFYFESLPLNVIDKAGEPWFIAKEVCEILEHSNHKVAVQSLDDDEVSKVYLTDTLGREQETIIISESGLYTLIIRSNKPKAKEFRKWVTGVVLPSIRKTGGYNMNNKMLSDMYERMMLLQEDMIKLQNRVVDMQYQQLSGKRLAVYSKRMREDIIDCYKNGYSTRVIAKMFGISINRVIDILSIELFI